MGAGVAVKVGAGTIVGVTVGTGAGTAVDVGTGVLLGMTVGDCVASGVG